MRVQVVTELNRARMELETEGRATQLGKLCATPFGVDIVGITEFIALIGALVGGAPRLRALPPPCYSSGAKTVQEISGGTCQLHYPLCSLGYRYFI